MSNIKLFILCYFIITVTKNVSLFSYSNLTNYLNIIASFIFCVMSLLPPYFALKIGTFSDT